MYSLLLVDDEKLELETLRDYVGWDKFGFDRVFTARGGREAYDKVQRLKPDVMITDIHMPVLNGIDLAKQLYEDGNQIKVVFLTGYDEFEYAKAALQVDAVDYILKPFSLEKISRAMERVKEQLHREELLKLSVKALKRRLIRRIVENEDEAGKEACYQLQELLGQDNDEYFGLIQAVGRMSTEEAEMVENSLSEVVYTVRGVRGNVFFLVRCFVDFRESADRILQKLEERSVRAAVIYRPDKVSVTDLHESTAQLDDLREYAFYLPSGQCFSTRQIQEDVCLMQGNEDNQAVHREMESSIRAFFRSSKSEAAFVDAEAYIRKYFVRLKDEPRMLSCVLSEVSVLISELSCLCSMNAAETLSGGKEWRSEVYEARNLEELEGICLDLCIPCIRFLQERRQEESGRSQYVAEAVRRYVETHYSEAISVEELACGIGLSPNYVRSLFRESEGITMNDWITEYRMDKACELLRSKKLRVKEVSRMVGYENSSYFGAIFARRYGLSPNEYRSKL